MVGVRGLHPERAGLRFCPFALANQKRNSVSILTIYPKGLEGGCTGLLSRTQLLLSIEIQ